jgi:hypothetical protein
LKNLLSVGRLERKVDDLLLLTAQSMIRQNNALPHIESLQDVEFRVYSQWGDDGIIQYLINKIPVANKSFVEFGVENYREANTRFLLINNNWRGLVFDGGEKNIQTIRKDKIYWSYNLTAQHTFITRENINGFLQQNGFAGNIGLLHIDIDGNDYWVWDAINVADPDIVILEYNALFGREKAVTIPYDAGFVVQNVHYSRLYFGASLKALCRLSAQKGYFFAGCCSAGINSYFISNRFKGRVKEVSPEEGFVMCNTRQARDKSGRLSFSSIEENIVLLKGLPVYNVETNAMEPF